MTRSIVTVLLALAVVLVVPSWGFSVSSSSKWTTSTRLAVASSSLDAATEPSTAVTSSPPPATKDPLLIRAARGEKTERTPVWMMRQAGRHIAEYRELCQEYPTFRQRSEIAEVAVEVSLQPWRNYKTDGCILFSDILTPLPGMGADFVIDEKVGPLMTKKIETYEDAKMVRTYMYLVG
jgi:uroporphyrinogen-III decarboxylase